MAGSADAARATGALNPPGVHGAPVGRGRIRTCAEDFVVDEELGFEPGGGGAHWYLRIRKSGATTPWTARLLARHADVAERDVGYSGLKDRHAVTMQWFSVPAGASQRPEPGPVADGIDIVSVAASAKKLRRGAHRANRFDIVVRDVDADGAALDARLTDVARAGFANVFGAQRFGRDGANLERVDRLIDGRRLRRRDREFAVSAARAWLFNVLVAARIERGRWADFEIGDRAMLDGSGSHFAVDSHDPALAERFAHGDIHPGATLWGRQGSCLAGQAAARERAILDGAGAGRVRAWLEADRSDSMLRSVRAPASGLAWRHDPVARTLRLAFRLPRGSYATALLRELLDVEDSAGSRVRPDA